MTSPTDDAQRDPKLERAWRAHSSEAPSSELDRAILAAAHRAVDSRPTSAGATRPQRWWMPLAAAATIGAVVVGLLQVAPPDQDAMAPTVVASLADKATRPAASPQAAQPMSREDRQRAAPAPESGRKAEEARPAAIVETPRVAPAAPPVDAPVSDAAKRSKETAIAADRRNAMPPPAPQSAAADEPRQSGRVTPRAPDSFPAAARTKSEASSADRSASNEAPLRESGQKQGGVTAPLEPSREHEAASEGGNAARSPGGAGDATGALHETAPARLAKLSSSTQAKARDPKAWIARIHKLREEGRIEEAQKELREFRAAFVDAEQRLPPELRDWMKP